MDLKAYLAELTPEQREAFALRCNTSAKHLQNIAYGYRPTGESLAIAIERESGQSVRCETLRPDVDWAYLRGTSVDKPDQKQAI